MRCRVRFPAVCLLCVPLQTFGGGLRLSPRTIRMRCSPSEGLEGGGGEEGLE